MRRFFKEPNEITKAVRTLVNAIDVENPERDDDIFLNNNTVDVFRLVEAAKELDLGEAEKMAVKVLEAAHRAGRNFARSKNKTIKSD